MLYRMTPFLQMASSKFCTKTGSGGLGLSQNRTFPFLYTLWATWSEVESGSTLKGSLSTFSLPFTTSDINSEQASLPKHTGHVELARVKASTWNIGFAASVNANFKIESFWKTFSKELLSPHLESWSGNLWRHLVVAPPWLMVTSLKGLVTNMLSFSQFFRNENFFGVNKGFLWQILGWDMSNLSLVEIPFNCATVLHWANLKSKYIS